MEKMEQQDISRTIKTMHKAKDYHGILTLVKGMNPDRIKDRRVLEMIADAYNKSGLYKDARENLLIAYERFPASRSVAYKLAIISVKMGNLDDAVDFYEDFCRLAPSDNNRYILKYIIGRAGGIEAKDLIRVLEQYNERESDERWLYELARLYHEVGRADDCVALCDEIALWYADGDYEKDALELKFMHKSLSASQQARYEQIMSDFVDEPSAAAREKKEEEERRLDQEAESFVSEFSQENNGQEEFDALFEEAKGKDSSVETFQIPTDKINEALNQEQDAAVDSGNITFRLPTDVINEILEEKKARQSSLEAEPEEPEDVLEEKTVYKPEAAPVEEEIALEEPKEPEQIEIRPEKESIAAKEPGQEKQRAAKKAVEPSPNISARAAAKLGVSSVKRSSKAYLIKRPSLTKKERSFLEEPMLRESVDTSAIPIANEEDGQIGINLNLIDKNDRETIDGQLTIDEFFEHYAGKVARSRDAVAAVEAERLRQIVESVKDMEPTPLYDVSFNTVESDDLNEEELFGEEEELITIDDGSGQEEPGAEAEPAAEDAKGADVFTLENEAEIPIPAPANDFGMPPGEISAGETANLENEAGELAEAMAASADEAAAAVSEELAEETTPEEEISEALPEEEVQPEEEMLPTEEEPSEEETPQEEEISREEPDADELKVPEAAAHEEINAEQPDEIKEKRKDIQGEDGSETIALDPGFAATLASFAQSMMQESENEQPGEDALNEEVREEIPQGEPEPSDAAAEKTGISEEEAADNQESEGDTAQQEPLDESLAAALEKFAQFSESEPEEADGGDEAEDALMGFGDDLADLVMGTAPLAGSGTKEEAAQADEFAQFGEEAPEDADGGETSAEGMDFEISDEFRAELKEFLLIDGIEENIKTACARISAKKLAGDTTGGNLIVTGDKKCGKTYLAIAVIKAVIKAVKIGSGKVVKVQAQPLNGKNISAVLEKVGERDLIIENVGYLKDETIENLIAAMKSGEFKQMIVLEGNMLAIENILVHFPEIEELFCSRIDIHELTITQWANIAKKYAKDQGYSIDAMADLALHARIDKINVPTARLGLGDVKDIVDSAIAKASKRNNGKLFAAFSKKGKSEISLTESDFSE